MKLSNDKVVTFFKKTDKEILDYLLQWWEMDSVSENGTIRLIGTIENDNGISIFKNIRNFIGDIINYPENLGDIKIVLNNNIFFKELTVCYFDVKLADSHQRQIKQNPFLLTYVGNLEEVSVDKVTMLRKKNIEHLHKVMLGGHPFPAASLSEALKQFKIELYTKKERLIFELIQNADDFPDKKIGTVDMKFVILKQYVAITHNGRAFREIDVKAISSIGDSAKRNDESATGYKGIGFKSVFTHSEKVYIYSGGYSFLFDKTNEKYSNFEDLYPSKEVQKEFRGMYQKYANSEVIPWEIMPIWIDKDQYPDELKNEGTFFSSNVAFGLYFGSKNVNEFKFRVANMFKEPRFLLFLRNINSIKIDGLENPINVTRYREGVFCHLQANGEETNIFLIPNEPKRIELSDTDIARFKNIDDIPPKLISAGCFSINFAVYFENQCITPVKNSVIFTYLPTEDNSYNFPFLVNSDFVTSSNREQILPENEWNKFVFEYIGYELFNWAKSIMESNAFYRFSFLSIIPKKFEIQINNFENVKSHFNKGFDKAIQEIAFLPTSNGSLCKVADALVDLTGLSEIIGYELFVRVVNPSKTLIDNRLESKPKLIDLQGISIFGKDELKKLFDNSTFQQVLNPQLLLRVLIFLQEKGGNFSDIGLLYSENSSQGLLTPSSLYFQTNQADKDLLTFKSVYFLHPTINDYAESNSKFKSWLVSLGVKVFEGANFVRSEIIGNNSEINKVLININTNTNFWTYIFRYRSLLLENEIKSLSKFYVIDVQKKSSIYVSECYLSDHFKEKGDPSTESIFTELGLEGYFLMTDYCPEQKNVSDWRKFFNQIGIKRSENSRIFKDKLVSFIQSGKMTPENYLKVTKFCFEVFNSNRDVFDGLSLSNFQVHTTDNYLKPISECILSDDYTQDLRLASVLPEQVLPNQIHSIYLQQISNNRQNWKEFFLRLNPNVELNSTDIVKRKISALASNPSLVTLQNVSQIWKTILAFKDELLKTHKEELKKIPVLLKNNTLALSTRCYFPKEYSPSTEVEDLLIGYHDYFISPTFSTISGLLYVDLKVFFKQIGVEEELRRKRDVFWETYDIPAKKFLLPSNTDFCEKFWKYFSKNFDYKGLNNEFKEYITQNPVIPCLDGSVKHASVVHSYQIKDLVNDESVTCSIELSAELETFLGLQQQLTAAKCFELLNNFAVSNDIDEEKIKKIYDTLLWRVERYFVQNPFSKISDIKKNEATVNFTQNGWLLSNKGVFQKVTNLFYEDVTADYLPLEESDRVVKRFGDKDYWKKFEVVLSIFGIEKITAEDFSLDSQSSKVDAIELSKTLNNSISEFANKIDITNAQYIENLLQNKLNNLKIYYSPTIKINCDKLNYSLIVPNYYNTSQNTIYFSGNWNSISNAKLIEYLFKAFDISESQISKDEFVSILLRNIYIIKPQQGEGVDETYATNSGFQSGRFIDKTTARLGEEHVNKELERLFPNRYEWLNSEQEAGKPYDFIIYSDDTEGTVLFYVDAKSTSTSEDDSDSIPFFVMNSEWNFIADGKENYVVARVFDTKKANPIVKFLNIRNLQ
ncbi:sacsin N-terminal ATP-binding-like domain-containing protein [Hugenholtzia roseola]|uniref:sacsin N-terminal ATP-binding-like domain-containing protein n=1 Tax=Hugenholtzia roseola TaxID=1002 RepID=UPI00041FBE92|nr:DUF3883 domain-containing protein [Hugenholtzia roseola]